MRQMRRKDKIMPEEDARALLRDGEYGVLASAGEGALPLATPLSYIFSENKIYFHCASDGHKIDNIRANPEVCFAVVGHTKPFLASDTNFTTEYESVLAFGKVREVTEREEKFAALMALAVKYLPEHQDKAAPAIEKSWSRTAVYAIDLAGLSGKAKRYS
ncbi:pyridoxamine 5'-phosphate oxidase family protein [Desulfovibrio sp. OttesenSCG-928-C14]|nr:pyridoxamine 5'-phosphate oxidase family protein [Desulfovibrio sp. OttesenSCG-928-C14]